MSRRVTRSSAKQPADISLPTNRSHPVPAQPSDQQIAPATRKRKSARSSQAADLVEDSHQPCASSRKRPRLSGSNRPSAVATPVGQDRSGSSQGMSSPGWAVKRVSFRWAMGLIWLHSAQPGQPKEESSNTSAASSSKKKSRRSTKSSPGERIRPLEILPGANYLPRRTYRADTGELQRQTRSYAE